MPRIRYKQNHCTSKYDTYTYLKNARRFTALFSNTPAFRSIGTSSSPSLSLSTIVHLTKAEYHNNSYSHEKTRRC